MSFKFEFKIDYEKLTNLLDSFLKSHSDELTSIMGQCLILQPSSSSPSPSTTVPTVSNPPPIPSSSSSPIPAPVVTPPVSTTTEAIQSLPDYQVDNRPLIGDSMPEDPLQNLFQNSNTDTTRFKDRNNIYNKKWNHDK